jgi:hypothetical protein
VRRPSRTAARPGPKVAPPAASGRRSRGDEENPIRRELDRRKQAAEETAPAAGAKGTKGGGKPIKTIKSVQKGGGIHPAVWIVGVIILAAVIGLVVCVLTGVIRISV